MAAAQPVVFDLDLEKAHGLRNRVGSIFNTVNKARMDQLEQVRWQIAETLNSEISRDTLDILRNNEIQNLIMIRVLPWLVKELSRGVVLDSRLLQRLEHGILVRSLATKAEILRLDLHQLMDMELLKHDLEVYLRMDLHKPLRIRTAILELLDPMLQASLVPNSEATRAAPGKGQRGRGPGVLPHQTGRSDRPGRGNVWASRTSSNSRPCTSRKPTTFTSTRPWACC